MSLPVPLAQEHDFVLDIYLVYAEAQAQYATESDAERTLQHCTNHRPHAARVYLTWSRLCQHTWNRPRRAREILQQARNQGAEPRADVEAALEQLPPDNSQSPLFRRRRLAHVHFDDPVVSPKRRKLNNGSYAPVLDDDLTVETGNRAKGTVSPPNTSLDKENRAYPGGPNLLGRDPHTEIGSKGMDRIPTGRDSKPSGALLRRGYLKPSVGISSQSKLLLSFRPDLGKPKRIEPAMYTERQSESDDETDTIGNVAAVTVKVDGEAPPTVPKFTKKDLSYMLEWSPGTKPNQKSEITKSTQKKENPAESAQNAVPVSIAKIDFSYIHEWDPSAPRRKSSLNAAGPKDLNEENDKLSADSRPSSAPSGDVSKEKPNLESCNDVTDSKENRPDASKKSPARSGSDDLSTNHALLKKSPKRSSRRCSSVSSSFLPLVSESNKILVNGKPYMKLAVIGKGGSSKVYRALAADRTLVGIKKVKISGMSDEAIKSYENEIELLQKLRGNPSIIQMCDFEVTRDRKAIFVVMEVGETDLNQFLQHQALAKNSAKTLKMNFIRVVWQQMLEAVDSIHEARIVHGDLKPANFVVSLGDARRPTCNLLV
jgi:tRNA A-37 threonylcarbamoyl transferase component Bud32